MEYWNFTPVSIIYFISAAISFLLVYFGFKLRPVKGAVLFSLMMFFVGLWVSAALIEFFNDKFEVMIIMIKIEYTAMAGASIFWLLFTSVYTNSDKWLKPWVYILIIIIPLITLYNIYQAPNETYIHETYEIVTIKGITIFKRNFANGFFIWTAFAYTMLLSGFIIVVVSIIKSSLTFKRQLIYLTPIIFIVLIPNLFFITGNNFIDPYDPTPLALLLVCILFLITMYQHKFLNISPVAHDLVFRNVKSAVIVIDIQGRIVEINPAGELILETANERYIGKELKQYLPEPVSLISESVGKSEIKAELTLGQDKRNYEVQITALENSSGLIRGHVILLWDITEQKMALFELDAYARSVAHDLKAPLGQIMGFAKLLNEEELLDDNTKATYLKNIEDGGEKMKNIIDGLLMLAKIRNQDKIVLDEIRMQDVLQSVFERMNSKIMTFGAEFVLPSSFHKAMGNYLWLEEVWVNLLSNAIKYGGRPPLIEFGSVPEGDKIKFWIKDNGSGLSVEEHPKLFLEFNRFHPNKAQIKGHGLGLSIVQRIITKMGGEVGVESKEGEGATFFFTLKSN